MSRLLPLCVLAVVAAGCGDDVCAGVDGACVALTVRGTGEIDGLDFTLSGAATGRRVAPERAQVATLPVHVALQLSQVQPGTLSIRVFAVRLGAIVGGGDTTVSIGRDEHVGAVLDLGGLVPDGGLTSQNDLSCPGSTTLCGTSCCGAKQRCTDTGCVDCTGGVNGCGDVCCKSGEVCTDGACALPFKSAELYVYLCPDFDNGCSSNAFLVGNMCGPITSAQPGHCYGTGLTVDAGQTYSLASCQSCPGNCPGSTSFTTPAAGFATATYYPGIQFYCTAPCTAPTSCP